MAKVRVSTRYMPWWKKYKRRWKGCQECILHAGTYNHVLLRGSLPFQVAFIGEAPGMSEDSRGLPFIGPAGNKLDSWIATSVEKLGFEYSYCILNTVVCRSVDSEGKNVPPPEDSIQSCLPHATDLIRKFKPAVVVLVGKVAKGIRQELKKASPDSLICSLYHPAYFLHPGMKTTSEAEQVDLLVYNLKQGVTHAS